MALRLLLIDKTPLGMRVDDAIQAVDWLAGRDDVDAKSITAYGLGLMGPAALHLVAVCWMSGSAGSWSMARC